MFGLPTFPKLLVFAVFALLAWWFLKRGRKYAQEEIRSEQTGKKPTEKIQDMVACPICAAYVPSNMAKNCGKTACPY